MEKELTLDMSDGWTEIRVLVDTDTKSGRITYSNIYEPSPDDDGCDNLGLEAALDAVESVVLGHACAGINIEIKAYGEGILTAIEAIYNQFS